MSEGKGSPPEKNTEREPQSHLRAGERNELYLTEHVLETSSIVFSSPLPPPDALKAYAEIGADYPDRIIALAENEALHRQECEKAEAQHQRQMQANAQAFASRRSWSGLCVGALIAILGLVLSAWLINNDHDFAGTVLGSFDLVGLVTVFVIGRRNSR